VSLLEVVSLSKRYPVRGRALGRTRGEVHALDDVSLTIEAGTTLGVVGESGCGKSTLARCIAGLTEPTEGEIRFDGTPLGGFDRAARRRFQREVQTVFQDPFASLNPRRRIGDSIAAPLVVHGVGTRRERRRSAVTMLERVGLSASDAERYPDEFSGGQQQRVGIARALILEPRLLIADEPVSALDVSVQAQILNLLAALQRELGLALMFIGHDLGVIRQVSDRVVVMYLGKVVEQAVAETLFSSPRHPYTGTLLSSAPIPNPAANARRERLLVEGDLPSPMAPPSGCRFHPRCPYATEICTTTEPPLEPHASGQLAACHHPLDRTA
jgi:oligopeptide transport system ATP-binding protein